MRLRLLLGLHLLRGSFLQVVPPEVDARRKELAERFKRGIAEALGVKPEDINQEVVERWALEFARAFVKPESWEKYGLA